PLGAETFGIDQLILENGKAPRDVADLVAALDKRHLDVQISLRQAVHGATDRIERTNQAAAEREGSKPRDQQSRQTAHGDPGGALEHDRVDIVHIDAGLDREQLFAFAIAAGIGKFWLFGTTRCFRHLVFEITAPATGLANDTLNQELALIVLVVP